MTDTKPKAPVKKRAPRTKPKTLVEKMFNVQADLQTVVKSATHAHNKYQYATERDFIAEVKPLLKRERLLVVPNTKSHTKVDRQHTVEVAFTIINVDNPTERTEPVTFYGAGDDKEGSVVGLPIAYTMALKYFLAKTFIAETGTDAEAQAEDAPKGKAQTAKESPEQAVATIKTMIANSRNVDGLLEYAAQKLPNIKQFTKAQKDELQGLIKDRVELLIAEQGGKGQGTLIK